MGLLKKVWPFVVGGEVLFSLATGVPVGAVVAIMGVAVMDIATTPLLVISGAYLVSLVGVGISLAWYRRRPKIREGLHTALMEAIEVDNASATDLDNFEALLDFQAKVDVVVLELETLGIRHILPGLDHWPLVIRRLREHAKRGEIEDIRRICEGYPNY